MTERAASSFDDALAAARARVLEAIRLLEREARRAPPPEPAGWSRVLAARWALVDRFEIDGRAYLLVRRKALGERGLEALSPREREAVDLARRGHSNKIVAYEMGVSASTVAVLLHRAARKLHCTRAELCACVPAREAG